MTTEKLVAGPLRGQIEAMRDNERRMANDCDDKESRQYNLYLCYVDAYNRVLELLASPVQGVQAYPRCEKCGKWRDVCICSAAGQRAEGAEAGGYPLRNSCGEWLGPFQCELSEGHVGHHVFDNHCPKCNTRLPDLEYRAEGTTASWALGSGQELREALQRIHDEDPDCLCEHDDDNCCAKVDSGVFCAKCIAAAALALPLAPKGKESNHE